MPIKHWWSLRDRFKQSIPGVVTANYLATVLNMQVPSARGNVLPYLKQMGIIDEEGKHLIVRKNGEMITSTPQFVRKLERKFILKKFLMLSLLPTLIGGQQKIGLPITQELVELR